MSDTICPINRTVGTYCKNCFYIIDDAEYIGCLATPETTTLHDTLIEKFDLFVKQNKLAQNLSKEQHDLLQACFLNGAASSVDYLMNVKNTTI